MTVASYLLLALTIVVSSFISGVFGMAGGMILLGVLLNYFDVPSAMILFSIIQFCANAWRAFQWRQYVLWPIFLAYGPGQGKVNVWDFTEAVRFWTSGKHTNHGFMLHGDSHDYITGFAREAKEVRDRPAVMVIYNAK